MARARPLSARKQAKRTAELTREAEVLLGLDGLDVQRLTRTLAATARAGGGTEGDVLVLAHTLGVARRDVSGTMEDRVRAVIAWIDSGEVEGVHGLPLRSLFRDMRALLATLVGVAETLWPDEWALHMETVEKRQLQIDHARVRATAMLEPDAEQLEEIRADMDRLGVEPDPELERLASEQAKRDGLGFP